MTQNQSVDINKLFRKLKNEGSQNKMRADSLSIMLDTERNGFSRSLENAQNAYMLSEEENEMLRETQKSLRIGRFAQDISVVTFMFTVVMLIKITAGR
jgi:hypothetical protein